MAINTNLQSTVLAKAQEKRFIKSLARLDITLFIVAAIISLDTIATIAKGGPQSLFWAVFVALTFLIPIAMLMAETGSAFPEEGGLYQWVKFAYGRLTAGIASVLYWITNPLWLGGSLCFIAFDAFSGYVFEIKSGSAGEWLFKLGFVWAAILLAIVNLKLGKKFIGAGAIAKISVISLLVITTVIYGIQNGFEPFETSKLMPTLGGFIAIAPVILFSYVGFEAPNAASGEMFDAKRDTAPAIRRGSFIATLAYILPVLAIILIVPADEVEGLTGFMGAINEVFSVYGGAADFFVAVAAFLFIFGLLSLGSAWMMATDRIQAIAAADGTFFSGWFGEFSQKFGTPVRVNILSGFMSSIFLVAAMTIVEGDAASIFAVVLTCAISTLLVSYIIIIPSVMKLNRTVRDVARPYEVPGGVRGFQAFGTVLFIYICIGSIGVVFPGTLEGVFGLDYDFQEIWGMSRSDVQLFTAGTMAVVILISIAGYMGGKKLRENLTGEKEF
jgi:amino acid transporter